MSFRPQYKNKNGNIVDLPIDAATVRGHEVYSQEETDARIAEKLDEKQTTEVNCSHETEITGFGEEDCNLVIDDQDVVITKIQGQTRRKSLNLLDIADVSETTTNGITYSVKNGVITLNGTATKAFSIYLNANFDVNNNIVYVKDFIGVNNTSGSTIEINFKSNISSYELQLKYGTRFKNYDTKTTQGIVSQFLLWINEGVVCTNQKIKLMLVSGTTAPTTYEPYDNTLVNSKCDFVSIGRNLIDKNTYKLNSLSVNITSDGIELTNATTNYSFINYNITSLPDGTYTLSFNAKYGSNTPYLNLYSNGDNVIKISTSNSITFTKSGDMAILFYIARNSQSGYLTITNLMLNYGDTALHYEPYTEDTMKCGLELGAYDYHDNINHITHRQTSEMITLNGSNNENWVYNTDTNRFTLNASKTLLPNLASTSNINIVNDYIRMNANYTNVIYTTLASNDMCYSFSEGGYLSFRNSQYTDVSSWKSYLQANPITFVYKLATETTEENILPSGYKVWYKGMQVQKTDTIPYILTKQYAISLASQVLNNVSIDRSQQKQIDDLKEKQSYLLNEIDDVRILPQQSDTSRTTITITADNINDYFNVVYDESYGDLQLTPIRPNEEIDLFLNKENLTTYRLRRVTLSISGFNKNSYDLALGDAPSYCDISIDNNIPINLGATIDSYVLYDKSPIITYTTGGYMYIRCVGRVCYISNLNEL